MYYEKMPRKPFYWLNTGHFYKYDKNYYFITYKREIKIFYDSGGKTSLFKPIIYNEDTYNIARELLDKICNEDYADIEDLGETLVLESQGCMTKKGKIVVTNFITTLTYDKSKDEFNIKRDHVATDEEYDNIVDWLNNK